MATPPQPIKRVALAERGFGHIFHKCRDPSNVLDPGGEPVLPLAVAATAPVGYLLSFRAALFSGSYAVDALHFAELPQLGTGKLPLT